MTAPVEFEVVHYAGLGTYMVERVTRDADGAVVERTVLPGKFRDLESAERHAATSAEARARSEARRSAREARS